MSNVILVSGSNRTGNTEYILKRLNDGIKTSELILLKDKHIEYCKGCLACHTMDRCIIKDDINAIIDKLIQSDIVVFGVPNYFDNVTGLFKNFIDRLHPLYKSKKFKDKKVVFIFVGGGNVDGTKNMLHQSILGFEKYLSFDIKHEYSFKALNIGDVKEQDEYINDIIDSINGIITK